MKITFKGTDGSVAIMTLADGANELETIEKFKAGHPGMYSDFVIGDIEIPDSREFRDAWTMSSTGSIILDKTKALTIHMNRLRTARNAKLAELDVSALKVLGDATALQVVEEKKQKLRDVTKQKIKITDSIDNLLGE